MKKTDERRMRFDGEMVAVCMGVASEVAMFRGRLWKIQSEQANGCTGAESPDSEEIEPLISRS